MYFDAPYSMFYASGFQFISDQNVHRNHWQFKLADIELNLVGEGFIEGDSVDCRKQINSRGRIAQLLHRLRLQKILCINARRCKAERIKRVNQPCDVDRLAPLLNVTLACVPRPPVHRQRMCADDLEINLV